MPSRTGEAVWEGDLKSGQGTMKVASGAFEGRYSAGTRFGDQPGSNPEELIGAAHAGCFSMAFAHGLAQAGFTPKRVHTTAKVTIDRVGEGFAITRIRLATEAVVPGIDQAVFQAQADAAKQGCPVSKALAGTTIELEAKLVR
ncbi:MAG TPA: OsmC family protein [Polyangia bacterium]|jgi:osmotically inducible protein OsmC